MMQTLTQHAHRAFWPAPDLTNFPSEATLTACVSLYLHHFAVWMPIIDSPRGNFLIDKSAPLLLKALAAVGSVFARDGSERLGTPLMELVRRDLLFIVSLRLDLVMSCQLVGDGGEVARKVIVRPRRCDNEARLLINLQCEHDIRFQYDVGVVQSTLLQAVFGLFSGSPKLAQHAEVARASLVASAKRMNLLNAGVSAFAHVRRSGAPGEDLERALKQDHRRRRLGWCIFVRTTWSPITPGTLLSAGPS